MMSTATSPAPTEAPRARGETLPAIAGPRLPYHPLIEQRFGIDRASWKALVEAVFPNATSVESVILALSYCRARKLDPFKRNVHIVPIWNKQTGGMVDTIWPGIGELRTTAFRTGEYAGRGDTVYGPDLTQKVGSAQMTFPEWAQVTVKRMVKGQLVDFCGPRVYWLETYATIKRNDDTPNDMWQTRPRGQLEKCAEAAALRAAFPEEIGGDYIPEEVQHGKPGQTVEGKATETLDDLAARLEGPSPPAPTSAADPSEPLGTTSHVGPDSPAGDRPETSSDPDPMFLEELRQAAAILSGESEAEHFRAEYLARAQVDAERTVIEALAAEIKGRKKAAGKAQKQLAGT